MTRKRPDPAVFLTSVHKRAVLSCYVAPDARVLTIADVAQLFEAWQTGHLSIDMDGGVSIATPGTGIAGIRWPPSAWPPPAEPEPR